MIQSSGRKHFVLDILRKQTLKFDLNDLKMSHSRNTRALIDLNQVGPRKVTKTCRLFFFDGRKHICHMFAPVRGAVTAGD